MSFILRLWHCHIKWETFSASYNWCGRSPCHRSHYLARQFWAYQLMWHHLQQAKDSLLLALHGINTYLKVLICWFHYFYIESLETTSFSGTFCTEMPLLHMIEYHWMVELENHQKVLVTKNKGFLISFIIWWYFQVVCKIKNLA